MRPLLIVLAAMALGACGLETASTAATSAAIKKQELEQGKRTMEQAQQKIGQSMQDLQRAADSRKD
jgi:type II secretory pathway component PulJ